MRICAMKMNIVRGIGQGKAIHRKYKKLKFGGGQAFDRSSDYAAFVA
jgi:hypothetical protein